MFSSDLPDTSQEWEALRGDTQAVHLRVAEHFLQTLRCLNLSRLAGTDLHDSRTYEAASDALDIALTALMGGNEAHGDRLHHTLVATGESVTDTLPRVKADIESEAR